MVSARLHIVMALYLALRVGAADFCAATTSAGERIDLSSLANSGDYVVSVARDGAHGLTRQL